MIEVLFDDAQKPLDYRFLQVNAAFEAQTGLFNAVGQTMRTFAPSHEEHWFETYGKVAVSGQPVRFENEAKALSRWYDVYAFRIGPPGLSRVAVLFNNVSERKHRMLEYQRVMYELEKSQGALESQTTRQWHNLLGMTILLVKAVQNATQFNRVRDCSWHAYRCLLIIQSKA